MASRLRSFKSFKPTIYSPLQLQSIRHLHSDINANNLQIELTKNPKAKKPYNELQFGHEFSDHMLEIDWVDGEGWKNPIIKPFENFSLSPAASSLHYALEAFEGLKAYIDNNNNIRLFRPDMNWSRLNRSCDALAFPNVNSEEFHKCVETLLTIEKDWIPDVEGFSLYVRPSIISTYPYIGVGPSKQVKLYVILSPAGALYDTGFDAVKLLATDEYVRAWPGGVGGNKCGSNYGPTVVAQGKAAELGYQQVLWSFPVPVIKNNEIVYRYRVEEAGTMNFFLFWMNNETGKKELVTPSLENSTILPGVTRDCVLKLSKEYGEFDVREGDVFMDELIAASKGTSKYSILEAFGAGTAAVISPIKEIRFGDDVIDIPLDPNDKNAKVGPLAQRIWNNILDIQNGKVENHPWSVVVDENSYKQKK